MNPKLLDLLERVGWTFFQALAGSIAAGGTAVTLQTFDWRSALVGAGVAAILSALKVAGVSAAQAAQLAASVGYVVVPAAPPVNVTSSPIPPGR